MAANHIVAHVATITVPVDPPAFPGPWIYLALLGDAERALYHCRYPAIRNRQREQVMRRMSTYNFRIPPIHVCHGVAASVRHLETVHLWQAHGYKLNASVGAIMANKMSGWLRYFHVSTRQNQLLLYSNIQILFKLVLLELFSFSSTSAICQCAVSIGLDMG